MACWAQREEPLGEGRPQSWKAGTKGTRDKGTGKEPAFSSGEGTPHSLFLQPSISLTHTWARKHPLHKRQPTGPPRLGQTPLPLRPFSSGRVPSGLLDQSVSCLVDASPAPTCVLCVCLFVFGGRGAATHSLPQTPSELHCPPGFAFLS